MQQNQFDFVTCYRQQIKCSIILLCEMLKHFHAICKKHVFVAVARENRFVSLKLKNTDFLYQKN